jgi:hypothetical protein
MLTNEKIEILDKDVNNLNGKLNFLYLDIINLFEFNFHEKTKLETSNRMQYNSIDINIKFYNEKCFWTSDGFLTIFVSLDKNDNFSFEYSHGSGGKKDVPEEISAEVFSEGLQFFIRLVDYIKNNNNKMVKLIKSIKETQSSIDLKFDEISIECSTIKKNIEEKSLSKLSQKIKILNENQINNFIESFIQSGHFSKEVYKLSTRYCDVKKECEYTFKKVRLTLIIKKRPSLYLNDRFFSKKDIVENLKGMILRADEIDSDSSIMNYLSLFDANFNNRKNSFSISEKTLII